MKLDSLEIGKDAIIASVESSDDALRQHILDMGLTPGTEVNHDEVRSYGRSNGNSSSWL